METFIPLIGGLLLLALGGELLVRGAVQLAERLGVSPLLIGLTLVGFGTSTPELVTRSKRPSSDRPASRSATSLVPTSPTSCSYWVFRRSFIPLRSGATPCGGMVSWSCWSRWRSPRLAFFGRLIA